MDERIKKARTTLGWSQAELARRMYVSQPSVADWESGRKAPHTKNLVRLAVLLGVSFEWLSTGRGEMHATEHTGKEFTMSYWIHPEEQRLLGMYASLKPKQRTALLGFLESLAS
ncbi:MAG: helix-turn-helix domain-containing protein [Gallionellaceae bacterium]|jgi:transcriptional regulator with XRE-family HTH domain|nr:helix-turn-helix domain-containing protein [Gallionellaceae bacterium]